MNGWSSVGRSDLRELPEGLERKKTSEEGVWEVDERKRLLLLLLARPKHGVVDVDVGLTARELESESRPVKPGGDDLTLVLGRTTDRVAEIVNGVEKAEKGQTQHVGHDQGEVRSVRAE